MASVQFAARTELPVNVDFMEMTDVKTVMSIHLQTQF
jgi:hypothetical protein